MSKVMAAHGDYIYDLFMVLEDNLFLPKLSYEVPPGSSADNCKITFTAWGVPIEDQDMIKEKLTTLVYKVFGEASPQIDKICAEPSEKCTIKNAVVIYSGLYED